MDQELEARLAEQDRKLDAIYASVEKMRRLNRISTIFQVIIYLIPLVGLGIAIPWLLSLFSNAYNGLL